MIDAVSRDIEQYDLVKATLSKPRDKRADLKNIYVEQIVKQDACAYKVTRRYVSRDITKIVKSDTLTSLINQALEEDFYNGDFFTQTTHHSLLQSKKGKATWLKKETTQSATRRQHDRQKTRGIPPSTTWLKDLGIVSDHGKVYSHAQDKYRQINRYVELVQHLLKGDDADSIAVRDMGSGKGYLTFALHQMLTDQGIKVSTQGIELRQDLVDLCNGVAQEHHLRDLSFVKGSIADHPPSPCDMVIALHACDVATDMAIAHAVHSSARYIVLSPCCHKQVRKVMSPDHVSMTMLRHGIHRERVAEIVTDSIRSLWLEARGYQTKVFEWISSEHTGKNVMITARYTGRPRPEAIQEIEAIKARYGVEWQWLERVAEDD